MISFLFSIAGCGQHVETTFTPYSVMSPTMPPVTSSAITVYPGDFDMLWRAGGVVIGSVYAQGDPTYVDLVEKAQQKAAESGGTHVILRNTQTMLMGANNTTGWNAGLSTSNLSAGASVGYDVIRVPPERWDQLPAQVRPAALAVSAR